VTVDERELCRNPGYGSAARARAAWRTSADGSQRSSRACVSTCCGRARRGTRGKIVEIEAIADPERLRQLDLAVLDDRSAW